MQCETRKFFKYIQKSSRAHQSSFFSEEVENLRDFLIENTHKDFLAQHCRSI